MKNLKCGATNKFLVLKNEDIENYLNDEQKSALAWICNSIESSRKSESKKTDNEYLVVNTDEKYSGEVIELLKKNGHWS